MFSKLTPEDDIQNIWNLGYVSSDKEESNDTDYEDYNLITLKAKGEEENEEDEESKSPFLIDYNNPNNIFLFVNV